LHIVTKFLVIFAAVLSILLAGLSIAYTSNAERLVNEVRLERDRATKAEGQAAAVTSASAGERESLQAKLLELETALRQTADSSNDLQASNARLLAEVNSLKQASVTHSAQIDQFTAVVQTYASLNKAQADELNQLRDRELDFARKEIELTDRVNDLSGELEVARETNRSLQEQLVESRRTAEVGSSPALGTALGTGAASDIGLLKAPSGFRSQITGVQDDESGATLVSIPAGTSDGLRERMKLSIVRDGFLATLILERVDQNESIGRVDYLGRRGQVEIRAGDLVMASTL